MSDDGLRFGTHVRVTVVDKEEDGIVTAMDTGSRYRVTFDDGVAQWFNRSQITATSQPATEAPPDALAAAMQRIDELEAALEKINSLAFTEHTYSVGLLLLDIRHCAAEALAKGKRE